MGLSKGSGQAFPTKPIRLLIGFPPGGGTDVVSRVLTNHLAEKFGQPIVIDYRPGAGGTLGNALAAKATPDGYTWLMTAVGPHVIAPSYYRSLPYDPFRDYAAIAMASISPYLLLVHSSVDAKTVPELVAWLRKRPTPAAYSTAGAGTPSHLASELFKMMSKVELTHVPYKGAAPALIDLLGGHVPLGLTAPTTAIPHIKSGRLRILAVTSAQRSGALPDVPTVAESGAPGFDIVQWYAIWVAAKTPKDIVDKLHTDIVAIIHSPDYKQRQLEAGTDVAGSTAEALAARQKIDIEKYRKIAAAAGIKPE